MRQTQSLSPTVTGKIVAHDKAIVLGGRPARNARGREMSVGDASEEGTVKGENLGRWEG